MRNRYNFVDEELIQRRARKLWQIGTVGGNYRSIDECIEIERENMRKENAGPPPSLQPEDNTP